MSILTATDTDNHPATSSSPPNHSPRHLSSESKMPSTEQTTIPTYAEDVRRGDPELAAHMDKNRDVKWCFENKEAIVELHSSKEYTTVFKVYCEACGRYFKHCMFSNNESKADYPRCRWCQADAGTGFDTFQIHLHIHCNKNSGKKTCAWSHSLEPPKPNRQQNKPVMKVEELRQPEVDIVVQSGKKKKSQRERKAMERKKREEGVW